MRRTSDGTGKTPAADVMVRDQDGLDEESFDFSAAVAAVTSAFGDPTRRAIYLAARESDGMTASEVAGRFGLHPNVARHHLERLAAGGYLHVSVNRAPSGAGRPSKRYRSTAKDTLEGFPARQDGLLVLLLNEAIARLGPAEAEEMAESVGEQYGRALAARIEPGEGQRSLRSAIQAVAEAFTAHGFAAHAETDGDNAAVISTSCPFGAAAAEHPVLCAVDRGMVRGMLGRLCAERSIPVTMTLSSRARGDDECAALV